MTISSLISLDFCQKTAVTPLTRLHGLDRVRARRHAGGMDLAAFRASLASPAPPPDSSLALKALWLDARGDWDGAHEAAQADDGRDGDWVHAYLHRKEGDRRQRRLLVPPRRQAGLPGLARRGVGGDRGGAVALGRETPRRLAFPLSPRRFSR